MLSAVPILGLGAKKLLKPNSDKSNLLLASVAKVEMQGIDHAMKFA